MRCYEISWTAIPSRTHLGFMELSAELEVVVIS